MLPAGTQTFFGLVLDRLEHCLHQPPLQKVPNAQSWTSSNGGLQRLNIAIRVEFPSNMLTVSQPSRLHPTSASDLTQDPGTILPVQWDWILFLKSSFWNDIIRIVKLDHLEWITVRSVFRQADRQIRFLWTGVNFFLVLLQLIQISKFQDDRESARIPGFLHFQLWADCTPRIALKSVHRRSTTFLLPIGNIMAP